MFTCAHRDQQRLLCWFDDALIHPHGMQGVLQLPEEGAAAGDTLHVHAGAIDDKAAHFLSKQDQPPSDTACMQQASQRPWVHAEGAAAGGHLRGKLVSIHLPGCAPLQQAVQPVQRRHQGGPRAPAIDAAPCTQRALQLRKAGHLRGAGVNTHLVAQGNQWYDERLARWEPTGQEQARYRVVQLLVGPLLWLLK